MPRTDLLTAFVDAVAEAVVQRLKKSARAGAPAKKRRGKLSAAGLAAIRAAQKKRWAEFRKSKGAAR